jgi:hypothetical protein
MPRVFDNELETSPRCFRAHKLGRTRIKKCNASGETVPCCAAGYDGRAAAPPYRLGKVPIIIGKWYHTRSR